MKDVNDVCLIVQARLGSQRIPNKMIKKFSNTTLIDICLNKLSNSNYIPNKNIYISAHEKEIINIAKKYDVQIYNRSLESALSEGTPMKLMYEWWDKIPFKYCVLVNACNPFLKIETIEQFYKKYLTSNKNGMFAVMEKKNYYWRSDGSIITPLKEDVMNTKTADSIYEAAHCLYASALDGIGSGVWMGNFNEPNSIELYPIEEQQAFDIDYPWQFTAAESMWEG